MRQITIIFLPLMLLKKVNATTINTVRRQTKIIAACNNCRKLETIKNYLTILMKRILLLYVYPIQMALYKARMLQLEIIEEGIWLSTSTYFLWR